MVSPGFDCMGGVCRCLGFPSGGLGVPRLPEKSNYSAVRRVLGQSWLMG